MFNHLQIVLHAHPLVASPPHQHFVKDNPQCPNITLLRILVLLVSLGCHILGGTNVIENLRFIRNLFHLAVPEIDDGNFQASFRACSKQYVIGFQISVYDALCSNMAIAL
jgi:hypothetical protein